MSQPHFIEIAVPLHLDQTFTYRVPAQLVDAATVGKRALVPFGRRKLTGYILGPAQPPAGETKEIADVLDAEPLFLPDELDFLRWAASYYLHPLGEVLKAALPAGINVAGRVGEDGVEELRGGGKVLSEIFVSATGADSAGIRLGKKERSVLDELQRDGELPVSELRERLGNCRPQIRKLEEAGLLRTATREMYRDPFRREVFERDEPRVLSGAQDEALRKIVAALEWVSFEPFLLHGITGSGKTEVYLQAIARALELGRTALVLVPEIALTPQLVGRFKRRFDAPIAVLHSGLSTGERYDEWRRIRRGEVTIVIGARSAIFAPLARLGIIVVDEEHEGTYKQSEGFRYNARDLALVRGKMANAVVVLGSATPQVTTYHGTTEGRLALLELPERVMNRQLPQVSLVDARGLKGKMLSPRLVTAIRETLAAGEQTLLFLNRRGFATFLVCDDCGFVLRCPNCTVTLTYHKGRGRNYCHYCDFSVPAPTLCPQCNGDAVTYLGHGTERVEEEVRELFPEARVARMDRDTTTAKGSHAQVLKGLEEGTTDILIGTQMIAKGHDFPGVTLVGVVSVEGMLHLPDFRSAERTFQLLSQVIGRAGRGDLPGRVLVQALDAEHYALERAVTHDYDGFFREEMTQREDAEYPPFSRLAAVHFSAVTEDRVRHAAEDAARSLRRLRDKSTRIDILGPASAPLQRVRGRYRWQILLKSPRRDILHRLLVRFRSIWEAPAGVRVHFDVDPVDML